MKKLLILPIVLLSLTAVAQQKYYCPQVVTCAESDLHCKGFDAPGGYYQYGASGIAGEYKFVGASIEPAEAAVNCGYLYKNGYRVTFRLLAVSSFHADLNACGNKWQIPEHDTTGDTRYCDATFSSRCPFIVK